MDLPCQRTRSLWVPQRGCPALVLPLEAWASPTRLLRRVVWCGGGFLPYLLLPDSCWWGQGVLCKRYGREFVDVDCGVVLWSVSAGKGLCVL